MSEQQAPAPPVVVVQQQQQQQSGWLRYVLFGCGFLGSAIVCIIIGVSMLAVISEDDVAKSNAPAIVKTATLYAPVVSTATGIPIETVEPGITTMPSATAVQDLPTLEPTATGIPELYLGDVVEQHGYSLVALTVDNPGTVGEYSSYEATPGTKLVCVDFAVGNIDAGPSKYSGDYHTVNATYNTFLVDVEGFKYGGESGSCAGQMELVDLSPGEKVRGWVGFEIPENALPAHIEYEFSEGSIKVGLLEREEGTDTSMSEPEPTAILDNDLQYMHETLAGRWECPLIGEFLLSWESGTRLRVETQVDGGTVGWWDLLPGPYSYHAIFVHSSDGDDSVLSLPSDDVIVITGMDDSDESPLTCNRIE